tara:strand:+ start:196 stop:795 length:600 start_codon:yes stop_codon:yes gene_type:complete
MGKRLGRKRLYALEKLGESSGMSAGLGVNSAIGNSTTSRDGHEIMTEITIDLACAAGALSSPGTANLPIAFSQSAAGVQVGGGGHLGQVTTATNGLITLAEVTCVEAPAGSNVKTDIDFSFADTADVQFSASLTGRADLVVGGGAWELGESISNTFDAAEVQDHYLYMTVGSATDGLEGTYTAGKYIIRLHGYAVFDDV